MEVAQKLPRMGRQPQNLPLSAELDRTRTALTGPISRATERIGPIYSPTMRRERRSHFILRQRSVEASGRGSSFGPQPRERPVPGRFERRHLGIYWRDREKSRPCFQYGEECHAVLFFDEADALFGKRTDVKDSHDRYANIEINYLLRRSEKYAGLTILAAGNRTGIDKRLLPRFHFIIPVPQRKKLRHKESSTC